MKNISPEMHVRIHDDCACPSTDRAKSEPSSPRGELQELIEAALQTATKNNQTQD